MKGQSYGALVIGLLLFLGLLYIGSVFIGMVATVYNITNNITNVYNYTINTTEFPAPNYDSGWINITAGTTLKLTHNLGGNADNYVVIIDAFDTRNDTILIHNSYIGTAWYSTTVQRGFLYNTLNSTSVFIDRAANDIRAARVRLRIWVIPETIIDEGAMSLPPSELIPEQIDEDS